jgi:tetratricopeptide (TPR) repeat protein
LAAEGVRVAELPDKVHDRIQELSKKGDALAEMGNYPAALEQYWAAWDLLPAPQTEWEASTWLLGAIGDANFSGEDYTAGRDNLSLAMSCPDAIGNPFLHLRLGQCQFELGNLDRAADELARAYMEAGDDIFEGEEKYFAFLKTRLQPPPGGW